MTASLRFQITALAVILCIGLFFSLRQVEMPAVHDPAPAYEQASEPELARMSPSNLEILLRDMLEKVRSGQALSHDREKTLKDIRRALVENMAGQPTLLARLLALIDEILLLNDELIYPDDGEPRTDEDR
ncbi:MAG: hypothetical protein H6556_27985 [Lewinellaceae bacterium]|nr:hypothetical protein [Lewinellaceae bacterium]